MAADTKNLKVSEFTCHCRCGLNNADQRLIDMCQKVRDELGVPVVVKSGTRCPAKNAQCGGVRNSQHLSGLAADLACSLGARVMFDTVKRMYSEGRLPELRYCKLYRSWIHIDCGKVRRHVFEG